MRSFDSSFLVFVTLFTCFCLCVSVNGADCPETVLPLKKDDTYQYLTLIDPGHECVFEASCIPSSIWTLPFKVTIENGTISIKKDAFKSFSKLASLTFGESTTVKVQTEAFNNCDKLNEVSFQGTVKSIQEGAFTKCEDLNKLEIPSSCQSLQNPCLNCAGLASITIISKNTKNYYSESGVVFSSSSPKTLVAFPGGKSGDYVIPDKVKVIGPNAFSYSRVQSVTIPASVDTLKAPIFYRCSYLKKFNVINDDNFYATNDGVLMANYNGDIILVKYPGGKTEANYEIPANATYIFEGAFEGNDKLTSLTIPASVATVGNKSFVDCPNLEQVTYLGSHVNTCGSQGITENCPKMTSVCVPPSFRDSYFCKITKNSHCFDTSSSSSSSSSSSEPTKTLELSLDCLFHLNVVANDVVYYDSKGMTNNGKYVSFSVLRGQSDKFLYRCDMKDEDGDCFFVSNDRKCEDGYFKDGEPGEEFIGITPEIEYHEGPSTVWCPGQTVNTTKCTQYCLHGAHEKCFFVDDHNRLVARIDPNGYSAYYKWLDDLPTMDDFAGETCNGTVLPPPTNDICPSKDSSKDSSSQAEVSEAAITKATFVAVIVSVFLAFVCFF